MTQPPNQPQGWWQPPSPAQGYPQQGPPQHPQQPQQGAPQGQRYGGQPGQPGPQGPQGQHPAPPQGHAPYGTHGGQAPQPQTGPQPSFGGSFQSQYGGLGAFEGKPERKPRRRKTWWIAGSAAGVLVVGAGILTWQLGLFGGDVLDQESLQTSVASVLRDSYGEHDVSNVECPSRQPINTGNEFSCTVEIGGQTKSVSIRVLNDKPEYEVGAPN
ncbi:DUF4333 domain-containing protein [Saccharomonospora sp. NPDC006951]